MAGAGDHPVPGIVAIDDVASRDLAKHLGKEWEALASYLGIKTNIVYGLKEEHLHTEDQIFHMLVKWRQAETEKHVEVLAKALEKAGRVDLAKGLESAVILPDTVLRVLSTKVGSEWQKLASFLGCSREEIDRHRLDHLTVVENQIFNLLVTWRQRQLPKTDVKDKLASALRTIGRKDLAGLLQSCSSEAWLNPYVFDLKMCRRQLRDFYKDERATINLIPFDDDGSIAIEDIFVELELEERKGSSSEQIRHRRLRDYYDLIDVSQVDKKKVLVRGGPGSGKTTLVSKFAHDWSCNIDPDTGTDIEERRPLSKFSLLFTINMRELTDDTSLVEAVFDQLLPDDTVITKEGLEAYIKDHESQILIILDGYDEYQCELTSKRPKDGIRDVLYGSKIVNSYLIVTSRVHRVSEFGTVIKKYANVDLTGFAKENIQKYIYKFFGVPEDHDNAAMEDRENRDNVDKLAREIEGNSALNTLAKTPVILALLCLLWRDSQQLPKRVTELYEDAMHYLVRRWQEREKEEEPEEEEVRDTSEELLLDLGKVALDGLFKPKEQLIFTVKDFKEEKLKKACKAGLLTKEKIRSKAKTVQQVSFVHKTFQEVCAGKYLADLKTADPGEFDTYLGQITMENIGSLEYMLRFCCGLSKEAALSILPQVVEFSQELMAKVGEDCRLAYDDMKQDPWRLSLLLLLESQCVDEYNLLKSLFNRSKLRIRFHNAEVMVAVRYFIEILEDPRVIKKTSKPKILEDITETELVGIRAQDVYDASKLIRNMKGVKTLKLVFLSRSEYAEMEQLGNSISQLPDLTTLILEGRDCDTSGIIGKLAEKSTSNSMEEFACHLSNFSIDALKIFISRQPSLKRLKLLDNRMIEDDIKQLLEGIQEAKLEVLEVYWNTIGGSGNYVRTFLPTLKSLYLGNTGMSPNNWGEIFCDMSKAVNLKKLDLTWNDLGDAVMMLADTGNTLDNLNILILRKGEFVLKGDDMDRFSRWLGYLVNLEDLDLSENDLSGASEELPKQLANLTRLTRLNLSGTEMKIPIYKKVGSALKNMPKLKQLHLSENNVGEAVVDVAEGLKGCTLMTWLNLEEVEMDSQGVRALTTAFEGLGQLTNFYIHGNSDIDPSGVDVLFRNIFRLTKLECLEMRGVEVDYDACSAFLKECFSVLNWRNFSYRGRNEVVLDKVTVEDAQNIAEVAARYNTES